MGTPDDESAAILQRLQGLHPKLIDLSLGRTVEILRRLGDPQDRLPPVIHVAGTNGKGSAVAFMRAICEASGRTAHVYTSPHLVRFNERIVVAGRTIADPDLVEILRECEDANNGEPITFFEITTAAAFLAFARAPADVVLLETGLGGRFDSTNVIDRPAASVITPISMDHMHYLGDTIEKIAFEKAGILRSGVPCVVAAQPGPAFEVIAGRARSVGCELTVEERDWTVEERDDAFAFRGLGRSIALPLPALPGRHQMHNASLAIAALQKSELFVATDREIADGLAAAQWPARLQRLTEGPLARALPDGWELWLDGGHNIGAAAVLADHLRGWDDKAAHLVVGMLNTRDPADFLAPFAGLVDSVDCVRIPHEQNALTAEEIAQRSPIPAAPAAGVEAAIDRIVRDSPHAGRILICGSLYLAGTVLGAA